jgi:hypothetical protein
MELHTVLVNRAKEPKKIELHSVLVDENSLKDYAFLRNSNKSLFLYVTIMAAFQ